jgi:AMP-polyphosphate phosphotransferase
MHVSEEEQLKRFKRRENRPIKQWKLTDEDWRNRDKRGAYTEAIEEMFERTSTDVAPWTIVPGDSKKFGRVFVIEHVIERIEAGMRDIGMEPLGEAELQEA